MKKVFAGFTLFDIIVIAMMAGLGIAVKAVLVPLVQIFTGPLFIPGGAVSGGIYMLFIVLGYAVVRKRFTAFLICLVQAILVTVTGSMGTHGVMSLVTYVLPGVGVEILYFIIVRKTDRELSMGVCFAGGLTANTIGAALVNLVFFQLPPVPLLLVLCSGALSGGLGGMLACVLARQASRIHPGHAAKKEDMEILDTDEDARSAENSGGEKPL